MNRHRTEVAIAGAGLAGRTLANLLCRNGIHCVLIDTGAKPPGDPGQAADPRALAITPASAAILGSIGIWQRLPHDRLGHFSRMHVWDEPSGGEIRFDSAELCEPLLGHIVEQRLLEHQLELACEFLPGLTRISPARAVSIEQTDDDVSLMLDQGDLVTARLLVAADGGHSPVRSLAGLDYPRHDYHQRAVACVVSTTLPHEHIARQVFLPTGPLAFLPMAEPRQCGIVWSTSTTHAAELLAMPEPSFRAALAQAFGYRLGETFTTGPRHGFDLYDAHAPSYIAGRLVLTGDAAHTVHPLAGQGANLGLLDVAVLAECILTARSRGRNPYSHRVLRSYERWRKADNLRMRIVLNQLKRLFEAEHEMMIRIRGIGLNAFDSIPCLKSAIMRQAMGLAGDLPAVAGTHTYAETI